MDDCQAKGQISLAKGKWLDGKDGNERIKGKGVRNCILVSKQDFILVFVLINIWNSREKWRKCISVTGSLRGQAQVQPIDKLDEACTNADDRMMLVQHRSADRVMS